MASFLFIDGLYRNVFSQQDSCQPQRSAALSGRLPAQRETWTDADIPVRFRTVIPA
jgi:hypothetical protein